MRTHSEDSTHFGTAGAMSDFSSIGSSLSRMVFSVAMIRRVAIFCEMADDLGRGYRIERSRSWVGSQWRWVSFSESQARHGRLEAHTFHLHVQPSTESWLGREVESTCQAMASARNCELK